MGVWNKKNFKIRTMDLSNISPFVKGHPLKCKNSSKGRALVDNFLRLSTRWLYNQVIYLATELDFHPEKAERSKKGLFWLKNQKFS